MQTQFCLVGHSHCPFIYREQNGSPEFLQLTEDEATPVDDERMIINPGGVRQHRDWDSHHSYEIFDNRAKTMQRHRVTYDLPRTQEKMGKAELPNHLIERLNHSI